MRYLHGIAKMNSPSEGARGRSINDNLHEAPAREQHHFDVMCTKIALAHGFFVQFLFILFGMKIIRRTLVEVFLFGVTH